MTNALTFSRYSIDDKKACLEIFDSNCPEYFSPNERDEYSNFLDGCPANYEICRNSDQLVGAFGLIDVSEESAALNWVLLATESQGQGIGSTIMARVIESAQKTGISVVSIAASHKSAPFFARFGATSVKMTEDGWGPGMHRVDMVLSL